MINLNNKKFSSLDNNLVNNLYRIHILDKKRYSKFLLTVITNNIFSQRLLSIIFSIIVSLTCFISMKLFFS